MATTLHVGNRSLHVQNVSPHVVFIKIQIDGGEQEFAFLPSCVVAMDVARITRKVFVKAAAPIVQNAGGIPPPSGPDLGCQVILTFW
jgi:hypothetical protein